jgi:hypothetical protein
LALGAAVDYGVPQRVSDTSQQLAGAAQKICSPVRGGSRLRGDSVRLPTTRYLSAVGLLQCREPSIGGDMRCSTKARQKVRGRRSSFRRLEQAFLDQRRQGGRVPGERRSRSVQVLLT